jgi:outer membrane murein-binding lipoprotein Lpp
MGRPERAARLAAMLVCLASSVGGQEPVPLTARAQSLVQEIATLETRVMEWETRATAAETEAARMQKENDALR